MISKHSAKIQTSSTFLTIFGVNKCDFREKNSVSKATKAFLKDISV